MDLKVLKRCIEHTHTHTQSHNHLIENQFLIKLKPFIHILFLWYGNSVFDRVLNFFLMSWSTHVSDVFFCVFLFFWKLHLNILIDHEPTNRRNHQWNSIHWRIIIITKRNIQTIDRGINCINSTHYMKIEWNEF